MSGKWVLSMKNGQLASTGSFFRDHPHGEWMSYNQNGQLTSLLNYSNGDLNGSCKHWFDNGQLYQEIEYQEGKEKIVNCWNRSGKVMVSNGNGKFEAYHSNGAVSEKGYIENGRKIGYGKRCMIMEPYKLRGHLMTLISWLLKNTGMMPEIFR